MTQHRWQVARNKRILAVHYGQGRAFPQIAALHLKSGYFRLTCGPCGWGTSVVLLPTFWTQGALFQGAPIEARWQIEENALRIVFKSRIAQLEVEGQIDLLPPKADSVTAKVSVHVDGHAALDHRTGEAFKPVMLSSMRVADDLWDANLAFVGAHSEFEGDQSWPLPSRGWIMQPGATKKTASFGLQGGTSRWKKNAPTVEIALDRKLRVSGWVTPSRNPNDDNIGLWAASSCLLRSWSYTIVSAYAMGDVSAT